MSTNNIFNEIDHRLSAVKRWTIIHTIRQQSVAEHCFNAALIASRIAEEWFGVYDCTIMSGIYRWALHHDRPEALSGDLPTISKDLYDEHSLLIRYGELLRDNVIPVGEFVSYVVKIADRMDAICFLLMEMSLGNKSVEGLYLHLEDSLLEHIRINCHPWSLSANHTIELYYNWREDLFPGKQFYSNHFDRRSRYTPYDPPTIYDGSDGIPEVPF